MPPKKIQTYFFFAALAISLLITIAVFRSYLVPLAFGGVLAVVSRPLFRGIHKAVRNDTIAALLTVFLVTLAFVIPLAFFIAALTDEVVAVVGNVRAYIDVTSFTGLIESRLPDSLHRYIPSITREMLDGIRSVATFFSSNLAGYFSNVLSIVVDILITFISFYYLLKDGVKVKRKIIEISPLGDDADERLFQRLSSSVSAVMGGMVIVALVQGVLAGIAFAVFGVPAPLFWGATAAFVSLIPLVGTSIVTAPAIAYLFFTGQYWSALGLAVATIFVVGGIDNILRPKLVESKTHIHPLLVLLSILGGVQFYGFTGFVLGPLTLTVTIALIDIYKEHFKLYLEQHEAK